MQLPAKQLAAVLNLAEDEAANVANIWDASDTDCINLNELLTVLVATSCSLTLRTKLFFFFRMWDCNRDSHVDMAEMAFLLKTLIYGIGRYCSWGREYLPDGKLIQMYAERTFKSSISEEEFVIWAMRHRLLRSTLTSFTPSQRELVDNSAFVLSGPKEPTVSKRPVVGKKGTSASKGSAGTPADLATLRLPQVVSKDRPGSRATTPRKSGENPTTPREPSARTSLPKVQVTPRRTMVNGPLNFRRTSVAGGELRLLDAHATLADMAHSCPLHKDVGRPQCMLLSKHEVLVANRLWHFIRDNRDIRFSSVRNLVKALEIEVVEQDSLIQQNDHRSIFKLTDTRYNRLFEAEVRRLRSGENVTFREFLHGVCPCASSPRLDLYETWHKAGHWHQEQAFVKQVKKWRRECEQHFKTPVMKNDERRILEAQMADLDVNKDRVLSVEDLVESALVTRDLADEMIKKHDLNGDSVLNINEYLLMFCPEGERTHKSAQFEELMRTKFHKVTERWKAGEGPDIHVNDASIESAKQAFHAMDDGDDGGLSLDDLVGYLDLKSAFGFLETYDQNADGNLSMKEFQMMVDPNQTISGPCMLSAPARPMSKRQARS